nr:MAG TPA: hypothetical protein [Caudoviricetes sp.]
MWVLYRGIHRKQYIRLYIGAYLSRGAYIRAYTSDCI